MLLVSDQWSVEWRRELLSEICKAEELVVDIAAGAIMTAAVCLQQCVYRRSVVYERDSACFQDRFSR